MEAIKERLTYGWFEDAGIAIEAEFKALADRIEKHSIATGEYLKKQGARIKALEDNKDFLMGQNKWHIESFKRHQKKIEALENDLRKLKLDTFLETISPEPMPPEPMPPDVPYDKDGKPEGGLKKWDVISYIVDDKTSRFYGDKILGQFHHAEGICLWGYWQDEKSGKLLNIQQYRVKSEVTFEFRPEKPEKEG